MVLALLEIRASSFSEEGSGRISCNFLFLTFSSRQTWKGRDTCEPTSEVIEPPLGTMSRYLEIRRDGPSESEDEDDDDDDEEDDEEDEDEPDLLFDFDVSLLAGSSAAGFLLGSESPRFLREDVRPCFPPFPLRLPELDLALRLPDFSPSSVGLAASTATTAATGSSSLPLFSSSDEEEEEEEDEEEEADPDLDFPPTAAAGSGTAATTAGSFE